MELRIIYPQQTFVVHKFFVFGSISSCIGRLRYILITSHFFFLEPQLLYPSSLRVFSVH